MQHFYHANLSDGKSSTAQFNVRGNKIYAPVSMHAQGNIAQPWFEIKNNKVYKTMFNPEGHSLHPQFEIRNNKVFTTMHHPEGRGIKPIYRVR